MKTTLKTTLALFGLFLLSLPARAETLYFLGQVQVAGHPPSTLPQRGQLLEFHPASRKLQLPDGELIGYIPQVFGPTLKEMQSKGVEFRIQVSHVFPNPSLGRYLLVEIWGKTTDTSHLKPLIYPIESEETPDGERW